MTAVLAIVAGVAVAAALFGLIAALQCPARHHTGERCDDWRGHHGYHRGRVDADGLRLTWGDDGRSWRDRMPWRPSTHRRWR